MPHAYLQKDLHGKWMDQATPSHTLQPRLLHFSSTLAGSSVPPLICSVFATIWANYSHLGHKVCGT